MNKMICSVCGHVIAESEIDFDTASCSWYCIKCGKLWSSSDGWSQIGVLTIPGSVDKWDIDGP